MSLCLGGLLSLFYSSEILFYNSKRGSKIHNPANRAFSTSVWEYYIAFRVVHAISTKVDTSCLGTRRIVCKGEEMRWSILTLSSYSVACNHGVMENNSLRLVHWLKDKGSSSQVSLSLSGSWGGYCAYVIGVNLGIAVDVGVMDSNLPINSNVPYEEVPEE